MDCYCASQTLYQKDKLKNFKYYNKKENKFEDYEYERVDRDQVYDPYSSKFSHIFEQTLELGSTTYPLGEIDEVEYSTIVNNPLKFYKEYIAVNKPCKIINAINQWPAMKNWKDLEYLKKRIGDHEITIDLTPDGYADSIYNKFFAQPKQVKGTFQDFLNMKKYKNQGNVVPYIQKQNGNLTSEFNFFLSDIKSQYTQGKSPSNKTQNLPDIKEFFKNTFFNGQEPDSINFWMGYSDSVSALHKDPYENIYAVIQGEKHFTLAPPAIFPYCGISTYKNTKWNSSPDFQKWWLEDINNEEDESDQQDNEKNQNSSTVWYSHNPDLPEDYHRYFSEDIPVYHVIVKSGEVLYLPALWFHQVTQFTSSQNQLSDEAQSSDFIIAANFWYDMEFDHKFQVFDMLKNLVDLDIKEQQTTKEEQQVSE
ncbi:cupin-like domain protein (macronuclear) [Tetrahymena thermophila SB210]|uniref:Cupin-like domain protein n=1 Tax=Tetrahymena thermophila (strain SB210) TaxID=312017 RepID=Q23Q16_TETTS|nr:cupin-like domain protein [Tetrahymena thermophila SB210]EAR98519.1 cupin-like domain protein [Tetrahymena thermophila SB210]|eukprot:XP_001018764.1 cupin-like domain protein [Tetrahymena thermophila SB210]